MNSFKRRFAAYALYAVAICAAFPAQALEIDVTKTDDTNGSCDAGDCSLREAIMLANRLAGVGNITINIPAGRYFITLAGMNEDAAATGDLDITNSMTLSGEGMAETIISGLGAFGVHDRVFHIIAPAGTVALEDLQINGGEVYSQALGNGGGILITDPGGTTTVNLHRCHLYGNRASSGGAIYKNSGAFNLFSGALSLYETVIQNNIASYGHGGGIYVNSSNLVIDKSTLAGNAVENLYAGIFQGGGLFSSGGATRIINSTFYKNIASSASEIYVSSGFRSIVHSTIVSGNLSAESNNILFSGDALSSIYNNIMWGKCSISGSALAGSGSEGNLAESSCISESTGSNILLDTEPLLLPLGNYGGPTPTAPPAIGSRAIDTGIYIGEISMPDTDQRGVARPQSGDGNATEEYDIGSVEREAFQDIFKRHLHDLRHMVLDQSIPQGIQKSLYRKVVSSEASYDRSKLNSAFYKLQALNNEVEAQTEKALTLSQANQITYISTNAMALLLER